MSDLDRLTEIVDGMTPGPWRADDPFTVYCDECEEEHEPCRVYEGETIAAIMDVYGLGDFAKRDSRGIAALRNVAPELIAVARAVRPVRRDDGRLACTMCKAAWLMPSLELHTPDCPLHALGAKLAEVLGD